MLLQVNRNWQIKMKKSLSGDKAFITEMKEWLYSFITYLETEEEERDSMSKLKEMLKSEFANEKNIKLRH